GDGGLHVVGSFLVTRNGLRRREPARPVSTIQARMAIRRQSVGSTHDTPRANTPIGSVRSTAPRLPARERALILGLLLLFAAICWTLLLRRAAPMAGVPMDGVAMGGMSVGGFGITQ